MVYENGPYVQAACLCDTVLEEKTGVLPLIRVIDSLIHTEAGPNPPEEMPPFVHNFILVIMLKSGVARGRSEIKVVPELPSGATTGAFTSTVYFEGEEKSANVVLRLSQRFPVEGLYWFTVHVSGQKLTAIPLRVRYNRLAIASSVQPGAPS